MRKNSRPDKEYSDTGAHIRGRKNVHGYVLGDEVDDIKKLWHYTNLQPLWKSENEEKSNLLDWRERFEWARELVELRIKLGLDISGSNLAPYNPLV